MRVVDTYWANIYVGLRIRYTDKFHLIQDVERLCLDFCSPGYICVTVTETTFIYKRDISINMEGHEPGVIVGLINYPRSPLKPKEIETQALLLANILMAQCEQYRVTVVFPDKTIMLGDP